MNPTLSLMLLGALMALPTPVSAATKGVKIPVKEVTVFKDGHAFVLHEGKVATDEAGNVVLDHLPVPVVVTPAEEALNLAQLIEANRGNKVLITEYPASSRQEARPYAATILSVPQRSSGGEEVAPRKAEVVLLKTSKATLVNELTDMEDVTVHLVVGVPSFAFKDNIDPISLQEAAAQLSQHFQESAQTAFALAMRL